MRENRAIPAVVMNAVIPGSGYMFLGRVRLGILLLAVVPALIFARGGTAWLLWMLVMGFDMIVLHFKQGRRQCQDAPTGLPDVVLVAVLAVVFIGVGSRPNHPEGGTSVEANAAPSSPPAVTLETSVTPETTVTRPTASAGTAEARQNLITYLTKSGDEPKIKDATWATDRNLYVGVLDDGSRRDGYAMYLCDVAAEHGVKPDLIKIVDVAEVVRTGKFVEIGKSYCH